MSHALARGLFLGALGAGVATLATASLAALEPKPVPLPEERDIALAKVSTLPDRQPQLVVIPELKGLDVKARTLRNRTQYAMGGRTPRNGDLAVYVVRIDDTVRAFIALDPRNGCPLKLEYPGVPLADRGLAFHDVCHGSLYDVKGDRVGGPTPWALDELVLTMRNGVVYAERHKVIPGRSLY